MRARSLKRTARMWSLVIRLCGRLAGKATRRRVRPMAERQSGQAQVPEMGDAERESTDQQFSRRETERLQREAQARINANQHPNQIGSVP
jgi:hypothetical protein